jgi:hypothetical protein
MKQHPVINMKKSPSTPPSATGYYRATFLALLFAGCCMPSLPGADIVLPAKENLHLFLLAGQSNMAGRGAVADLTAAEKAPDPRVLALDATCDWRVADDPIHWDKAGAGVGVGKFFGKIIADAKPGVVVGLIPAACGGSSIVYWEPSKFFGQTNSVPWNDAIHRARRAMRDGTLKAILWHQGESDTGAKNADLYEERLEKLINRFREELKAPELPFIIGQIGRLQGSTWEEGKEKVDRAQQAVAAKMRHVYFVSADGLVSSRDKIHFDTSCQRIFAQRYAAAYQQDGVKK